MPHAPARTLTDTSHTAFTIGPDTHAAASPDKPVHVWAVAVAAAVAGILWPTSPDMDPLSLFLILQLSVFFVLQVSPPSPSPSPPPTHPQRAPRTAGHAMLWEGGYGRRCNVRWRERGEGEVMRFGGLGQVIWGCAIVMVAVRKLRSGEVPPLLDLSYLRLSLSILLLSAPICFYVAPISFLCAPSSPVPCSLQRFLPASASACFSLLCQAISAPASCCCSLATSPPIFPSSHLARSPPRTSNLQSNLSV
eukprot:3793911-Rhodomonas_salina.1